jgi:hypothetical protein
VFNKLENANFVFSLIVSNLALYNATAFFFNRNMFVSLADLRLSADSMNAERRAISLGASVLVYLVVLYHAYFDFTSM